jgi:hypothetical protein
MIALIIGTTIATVLGLVIFHEVSKKRSNLRYDSMEGTVKKVVNDLDARMMTLEKWTVDISEVYNRNKRDIADEIVGLSKWTEHATTMVNENLDDVKEVQETLLEMKLLNQRLEKEVKQLRRRRKVRYNVSAHKY